MDIKVDSLDNVPEDLRSKFVEWKDGDKTMFVHEQYASDMKEHFRLKGDFTELKGKFEDTSSKLEELSKAEREREERKKREELEGKKKNGQYDDIIADWERKYEESQKVINDLNQQRLDDKKQLVVEKLAAAGTESTRPKLARLIQQDIGFSEDGNMIVLDESGKATSQTVEQYSETLKDLYPELIAAGRSSGGKGNGGLNGGGEGSKTMKRAEFEAMDHGSRAKFFKDGGKLID